MKKKRGSDAKFKEDMPEGMVLEKWPKLLDVQVKLGETAALEEMRSTMGSSSQPARLTAAATVACGPPLLFRLPL